MSLNFDVSKVKDYKDVTTAAYEIEGRPQWNPVTNTLVWWTIPIGISSITEKNVDEFWSRLSMWQAVVGPVLSTKDLDIWLTRDDVVAHIGLQTNASDKTKAQFYATCQLQLEKGLGGMSRSNPNKLSALRCCGWQGHPSELSKEKTDESA